MAKRRFYKDGKYTSEEMNDFFKIKDSFLDKIGDDNLENRIFSLKEIEMLKTREYVEYITKKLHEYYKKK
jgi:hypothetical protein